jgi:hypothetical protein
MLKDKVADLMAVPLLNQQEMRSKGTVSYWLKNSYKFGGFLEKQMYNTAVLDGIMQNIGE